MCWRKRHQGQSNRKQASAIISQFGVRNERESAFFEQVDGAFPRISLLSPLPQPLTPTTSAKSSPTLPLQVQGPQGRLGRMSLKSLCRSYPKSFGLALEPREI